MSKLPDVLAPGLVLVFCGSAASTVSARKGAYYAGPGNRFWETLHRVGLTPARLAPEEFRRLIDYGIGLTDLSKTASGGDDAIALADYDAAGLRDRIERFTPRVLAFTSKRPAQVFLGHRVQYGAQAERIGNTILWVLPSTSGAARRYWDESVWRALAAFVDARRRPGERIAQYGD